jgi:hypothetical protein
MIYVRDEKRETEKRLATGLVPFPLQWRVRPRGSIGPDCSLEIHGSFCYIYVCPLMGRAARQNTRAA